MSIKIMSGVWEESKQEASTLLLLLALADHASDDGVCYPGITRLAHKTRKSPRHTKRLVAKLEESGEVFIERGVGRRITNQYFIVLGFDETEIEQTLMRRYELSQPEAAQKARQIIEKRDEKGDAQDTFSGPGDGEKGDIQGQEKVTLGAEKVTPRVKKGDIAVSSESSGTVIEPSVENHHDHDDESTDTFQQADQSIKVDVPARSADKKPNRLPDTKLSRTMFGRLQANARAIGRKGPSRFGTLEQKGKFDDAATKLGATEFERALQAGLKQGINSVERLTNWIAKWNGNSKKGTYNAPRQRIAPHAVKGNTYTPEEGARAAAILYGERVPDV